MLSLLFLLAAASALPTVSFDFFRPGRAWTWEYRRADNGSLYSTETYSVVQRAGRQVLLEMSTSFPGQGVWRAHHRLLVNVDRCLAAYRNPVVKEPWSFRMFFKDQSGRWIETEPPTTLAFEEKFNCNPHMHDSREYLTVVREDAFMHKRWRTLEGSWFSLEGSEAGVMAEKNFNHGSGTQNYIVKRR
jgi:hypothetical protein